MRLLTNDKQNKKGGVVDTTLTLIRDPVVEKEAVTLRYLNNTLSAKVKKNNGLMTGPLQVTYPSNDSHVATKAYTDSKHTNLVSSIDSAADGKVNKTGDTLTGPLYLSNAGVNSLHAVTKQQVDQSISSTKTNINNTINGLVSKSGDTVTGGVNLTLTPTSNNHAVNKQYVDNIASGKATTSYFNSKIALKLNRSEMGSPGGIATLDSNGKISMSQLPTYISDVLEYTDVVDFPSTGEVDKLYLATATNKIYRWTGSSYLEVSKDNTDATEAYRLSSYQYITIGNQSKLFNGANTVSFSQNEIGIVDKNTIGTPNGLVPLNSVAKVPSVYIDSSAITLKGPRTVYSSQTLTYTLSTYSSFDTYSVSVDRGTASISGDTITFNTPTSGGAVNMQVSRNGYTRTITLNVIGDYVKKPTITSPTNNQTNVSPSPTIISSSFQYVGAVQTHVASQWQIATDIDFLNVVRDTGESTSYLTQYTPVLLDEQTNFYLRVRHKGSVTGWSEWSDTITFKTAALPVLITLFNKIENGAKVDTVDYNHHINIENGELYHYFMPEKSVICKTDKNFNVIWAKRIQHNTAFSTDPETMTLTVENGFPFVYVSVYELSVAKLSGLDGSLIWCKLLTDYDYFPSNDVYILSKDVRIKSVYVNNEPLIVCSFRQSVGSNVDTRDHKNVIVVLNKNGNFVSGLQRTDNNYSQAEYEIYPVEENNELFYYLNVFTSTSSGTVENVYRYHVKMRGNGETIWKNNYSSTTNPAYFLRSVSSYVENGQKYTYFIYEIYNENSATYNEVLILKKDAAGNFIAGKEFRVPKEALISNYTYYNNLNLIKEYEGNYYLNLPVYLRSGTYDITKFYYYQFDSNLNFIQQIEMSPGNTTYLGFSYIYRSPTTYLSSGYTINVNPTDILDSAKTFYVESDQVYISAYTTINFLQNGYDFSKTTVTDPYFYNYTPNVQDNLVTITDENITLTKEIIPIF